MASRVGGWAALKGFSRSSGFDQEGRRTAPQVVVPIAAHPFGEVVLRRRFAAGLTHLAASDVLNNAVRRRRRGAVIGRRAPRTGARSSPRQRLVRSSGLAGAERRLARA